MFVSKALQFFLIVSTILQIFCYDYNSYNNPLFRQEMIITKRYFYENYNKPENQLNQMSNVNKDNSEYSPEISSKVIPEFTIELPHSNQMENTYPADRINTNNYEYYYQRNPPIQPRSAVGKINKPVNCKTNNKNSCKNFNTKKPRQLPDAIIQMLENFNFGNELLKNKTTSTLRLSKNTNKFRPVRETILKLGDYHAIPSPVGINMPVGISTPMELINKIPDIDNDNISGSSRMIRHEGNESKSQEKSHESGEESIENND